ncbi:GFA family protein [Rhizobium sp. YIM 134829]|uniref:GFA family protein n=1 Tax=Rhizobium sp. YIM 134829 TaxID=3390453 RepID=UPI00397BD304
MPLRYTGGCACGALRYEISGEPAAMLNCQCRQCQRESGTGHQSHLTFVAADVSLQGEPAFFESVGEGGTVKRRGFCRTCGNPVYLQFPAMPEVLIVTPSSLDDPSLFKPHFVTWTQSGQAWDHLDPAIVRHQKMPA